MGILISTFFLFLIQSGMSVLAAQANVVDRVVAIVNQEVITLSELRVTVRQLENPLFQELSAGAPISASAQGLQDTLRHLIEKKLQMQIARKKGITVHPEELEQALQEIRQRQGLTSNAGLERLLSRNNLNLPNYTQEVKDRLTILKLIDREILFNIVIRDEEVSHYYQSHSAQFILPEKVHLAQILLELPKNADEKKIEEMGRKAQEIRAQLLTGADFGEAARTYSDGPGADQGGDLGYFKKGEMRQELDQAAFSLEPGQISGVIRSPIGFHLFKVLQRKAVELPPYEEVKQRVQQRLFLERSETAYQEWLKGLRAQAYVEVKM